MEALVSGIVVFVLAMFVGVEIIKKVPSLLHTPLTSGSNAISGITILGSMVVSGMAAGCAKKAPADDGMAARIEAAASKAEMAANKAEAAAKQATDAAQRADAAAQKAEAMYHHKLKK